MGKNIIFEIEEVSNSHHETLPDPPEKLGRMLTTLEEAKAWLLHPSNWFESDLDILRWDGLSPKISRSRALAYLRGETNDDVFLGAIVGQRNRRAGRVPDPAAEEPIE